MVPLVLLPGLGNTAQLFDFMKPHFGHHKINHINLISEDIQNFDGMLAHVRQQLLADSVKQPNGFSEVPDGQFDMLGFSMGGYVALALALAGDLPIRRLILVNSRAVDDDVEERAGRARTLKLLDNPKTRFEGMTPGLFKSLVGPAFRQDAAMYALVRHMAQVVGRRGLAAQIRANQTRPNMVEDLAGIKQKTLIVGGTCDRITPPDQAQRLHAGIQGSKLHIFEGCGHLSPLERPDELAALIIDFVTDFIGSDG